MKRYNQLFSSLYHIENSDKFRQMKNNIITMDIDRDIMLKIY